MILIINPLKEYIPSGDWELIATQSDNGFQVYEEKGGTYNVDEYKEEK